MFYPFLLLWGLNLIFYLYVSSSGTEENHSEIIHPGLLKSTYILHISSFNRESLKTYTDKESFNQIRV